MWTIVVDADGFPASLDPFGVVFLGTAKLRFKNESGNDKMGSLFLRILHF
jgi:hypothetical protein